jgi:hypothetical protein
MRDVRLLDVFHLKSTQVVPNAAPRDKAPGNFDAKIDGFNNRAIPFIRKRIGPYIRP